MDCCTAFCSDCRVTSRRTTSSERLVSLFRAWSCVTMVMSQPFTWTRERTQPFNVDLEAKGLEGQGPPKQTYKLLPQPGGTQHHSQASSGSDTNIVCKTASVSRALPAPQKTGPAPHRCFSPSHQTLFSSCGTPVTCMILSPICNPAISAGPPSDTRVT